MANQKLTTVDPHSETRFKGSAQVIDHCSHLIKHFQNIGKCQELYERLKKKNCVHFKLGWVSL